MSAPFGYYGGKIRLAPKIIAEMPQKMDVYLEPFFGSGAVFFSAWQRGQARWANTEIVNDINQDVINFFRVLRDRPEELIDLLQVTPYSRQEIHEASRIMQETKDPIRRALYFFIRAEQSFSSNQRNWSVPDTYSNKPQKWARRTRPERMLKVSARLRETYIENMDALELIRSYDNPDVFIYLDPPYLSVASRRDMQTSYKGNGLTEEQHAALVKLCLQSPAMFIISGYDHAIYSPLIENGWRKKIIETDTRVFNHRNNADAHREEILWISPNIENGGVRQISFLDPN